MDITTKNIPILVLLWSNYPTMGAIFMDKAGAVALWVMLWSSYVVALRVACCCCKENAPSWYGSAGVMLGVALVSGAFSFLLHRILYWIFAGVLGLLLDSVLGPFPRSTGTQYTTIMSYVFSAGWVVIGVLLAMLTAAGLYAAVIPGVTFGKGVLLYGVQCGIVLASVMVVVLCYAAVHGFP